MIAPENEFSRQRSPRHTGCGAASAAWTRCCHALSERRAAALVAMQDLSPCLAMTSRYAWPMLRAEEMRKNARCEHACHLPLPKGRALSDFHVVSCGLTPSIRPPVMRRFSS